MSSSEKENSVEFHIACRNITIEDIIRCSYSLTKTEFRVLKFLLSRDSSSVSEIARCLALERSTVQKILQKLMKKKIVYRRQINLNRGYKYLYMAKSRDELKRELLSILERWYHRARDAVSSWM